MYKLTITNPDTPELDMAITRGAGGKATILRAYDYAAKLIMPGDVLEFRQHDVLVSAVRYDA